MTDPAPTSEAVPTIGVLIVDDVSALRGFLIDLVERTPDLHVAGEAGDGREAIVRARELQPDVILLDLSMPVLTGLEALPEIKVVAPESRVIVFTGLSANSVSQAALAAGADMVLQKGSSLSAIVGAIRAAYGAEQLADVRAAFGSVKGDN